MKKIEMFTVMIKFLNCAVQPLEKYLDGAKGDMVWMTWS